MILTPFLPEAVEATQCYFFENWVKKLKCPHLLNILDSMIWENYWSFYPSEPFTLARFNMRHPEGYSQIKIDLLSLHVLYSLQFKTGVHLTKIELTQLPSLGRSNKSGVFLGWVFVSLPLCFITMVGGDSSPTSSLVVIQAPICCCCFLTFPWKAFSTGRNHSTLRFITGFHKFHKTKSFSVTYINAILTLQLRPHAGQSGQHEAWAVEGKLRWR